MLLLKYTLSNGTKMSEKEMTRLNLWIFRFTKSGVVPGNQENKCGNH